MIDEWAWARGFHSGVRYETIDGRRFLLLSIDFEGRAFRIKWLDGTHADVKAEALAGARSLGR